MAFRINLLAAGLFIVSAVFWGLSTRGKKAPQVPEKDPDDWEGGEMTIGDADLEATWKYQAKMNKIAAGCAGIASALQALGLMLPPSSN